MGQQFATFAINFLLRKDHFIDAVIVPLVMWRHLVEPFGNTGVDVARHDGHGPAVVARTLTWVPGRRVACAVVDKVLLHIGGIPAPSGAAADHPLIAFPGVGA